MGQYYWRIDLFKNISWFLMEIDFKLEIRTIKEISSSRSQLTLVGVCNGCILFAAFLGGRTGGGTKK